VTIPFSETEHREQPRRISDIALDDLYKTFSTPHCHSCLESMADAVLLLDSDRQSMYTSAHVDQLMNRSGMAFTLVPKFSLRDPVMASRFSAFVNGKNTEAGPLSLLLGDKDSHDKLLLTCFRLPEISTPGLHAARFMITFRTPDYYPVRQWQVFTEQFTLTQAEARLCHALADGLTIRDYCGEWHVAVSTARSQLRSVFAKTATRRQSELLRLIYLFTRT